MTCIVGLVDKGKVYIGSDSAGVSGLDLQVRTDKKICINRGFAMGFTTSFRMGQLLTHAFVPPERAPDADLMKFMVVDFINAVRACLKEGGFAMKQNEAESGGTFLVGYRGRLFTIYDNYQVAELVNGFGAVGCGEAAALGALHATEGMQPKKRILTALRIAEKCSGGVREPFHIVSV